MNLIKYLRNAAQAGTMEYHLRMRELPEAQRMPWIGPHLCDAAADEIERMGGLLAEAERLCMEHCQGDMSEALRADWATHQMPNAGLSGGEAVRLKP